MRYKDRTGKKVCANGQQDTLLQNVWNSTGAQVAVSVSSACCFKIAGRFMDSGLSAVLVSHLFRKIISTCHNMKTGIYQL